MEKRFFVNKEKGVIVCVMNNPATIHSKVKHLDGASEVAVWFYNCETHYAYENFRGFARCNPIDEFDEDLGKKIASTRSDVNYHKALLRDLKKVKEKMLREIKELDRIATKEEQIITNCQKHLEKLVE